MWIPSHWGGVDLPALLEHWPVFKSCFALTTPPRSLYHVNRGSEYQANYRWESTGESKRPRVQGDCY